MAQPEPKYVPLLQRPDLIEEVNRMAAHIRSRAGQAEIAAWAKALREDPVERRLQEALEGAVAETPGWEWTEDL